MTSPNDAPPYGVTPRDYFAAHAPITDVLVVTARTAAEDDEGALQLLAKWSYAYADAMLAERDK